MNTEHTNQSRAQFEAWASEHCCATGGISFKRFSDDGADTLYNDPSVETAWQAWQAASQQQAMPVAWLYTRNSNGETFIAKQKENWPHHACQPLYTKPPAVAVPEWLTFDRLVNSLAIFVYGATQNPLRDQLTLDHWENTLNDMASQSSMFNAMAAVRAMLAAAPQGADPIKRLIAMHNELLGEYPYCYFELAYTRRTDWMAWLCTKPREDDPERKVLACGQGLTAEEACAEAISAAQKGGA